jgi:hypothetical protein
VKPDDIRLFPNATASLLAANAEDSRQAPELERPLGNAALGAGEGEARHTGRFLVRVTSVRKRLLDPDNLAEKYHIDCCRYAGLIHQDSADKIEIQTGQRKAARNEEEYTQVDIFTINEP